jgi:hypothetical protein
MKRSYPVCLPTLFSFGIEALKMRFYRVRR